MSSRAAVAALLVVVSATFNGSASAQIPGGRAFDQVPRRDPGQLPDPVGGARPPPADEGLGGWGPSPLRDGASLVRVQLAGAPSAKLYQLALGKPPEQRLPTAGYGREVCTAPCDELVDASSGETFTVALDGAPPSDPFALDGHGRHVTVDVDPGDDGALVAGQLMLGPGIGGATVGGFLLVVGASESSASDLVPVSAVILGASAALITAGVALIVAGDTDVDVRPSPTVPGARGRAPRLWRGEF